MGTHPIFESDFDCLTDCSGMQSADRNRAATLIQASFRGYQTRKRNASFDVEFAALVADIEPEKVCWDRDLINVGKVEPVKGASLFRNR